MAPETRIPQPNQIVDATQPTAEVYLKWVINSKGKDTTWMQAPRPCKNYLLELFTEDIDANIEEAKTICHTCPVEEACREYSILTEQDVGTWGGLSQTERNRLIVLRHNS